MLALRVSYNICWECAFVYITPAPFCSNNLTLIILPLNWHSSIKTLESYQMILISVLWSSFCCTLWTAMNFIKTCTDTYLGQPKRIIIFWRPRPYLQGHQGLDKKSLSVLYLANQWPDFDQTDIDNFIGETLMNDYNSVVLTLIPISPASHNSFKWMGDNSI